LCNTNNGDNLIDNILNESVYKFNNNKKYKNSYIYLYFLSIIYIIALTHNNSTFVISVLINCMWD